MKRRRGQHGEQQTPLEQIVLLTKNRRQLLRHHQTEHNDHEQLHEVARHQWEQPLVLGQIALVELHELS